MTIKQVLQKYYLADKKLDNNEIDQLLALALHKNLNYLYTYPEKTIPVSCQKKFAKLYRQRLNHWPLAYLKKTKEFYNLKFFVNQHVLIPRPDTEILVEQALAYLGDKKKLNVLDLGTGSGCLAISLAKNNPDHNYLATDISKDALKVAKTNVRKNKVKIKFLASDLFAKINKQKFDLVLANLPYLSRQQMSEPSLKHEPKNALVSGKEGLDHYQRLLSQIKSHLNKNFLILLEIDPEQDKKIIPLIQKYLPQSSVEILADLAGKNRLVKISQK